MSLHPYNLIKASADLPNDMSFKSHPASFFKLYPTRPFNRLTVPALIARTDSTLENASITSDPYNWRHFSNLILLYHIKQE